MRKVGLAEQKTKGSKLAVNYRRGCDGRRNSKSHGGRALESGARVEPHWSKWHCSLSDPSPTDSTTMQQKGLPRPSEYLRLCPLKTNRSAKTKKYGPNERTDQNSRKRAKEQGDGELT